MMFEHSMFSMRRVGKGDGALRAKCKMCLQKCQHDELVMYLVVGSFGNRLTMGYVHFRCFILANNVSVPSTEEYEMLLREKLIEVL